MMRSFLTRFPNSLIGIVLLVPGLLICLACATPFPIESLEEGMTAETVRENFGEPVATYTFWDPQVGVFPPAYDAKSSWTYYVGRKPVVLYFRQEKLIRWEVIEPVYTEFYVPSDSLDSLHHAAGHTHHHGH